MPRSFDEHFFFTLFSIVFFPPFKLNITHISRICSSLGYERDGRQNAILILFKRNQIQQTHSQTMCHMQKEIQEWETGRERERERKRSGCSLVEIIARCSQSTMDTGRERDGEGDNFKSKHQAYVDLAPSICRDAQQRPQTCSGRREQSKDPQTDSDPLAIYEKWQGSVKHLTPPAKRKKSRGGGAKCKQ